MMWRSVICFSAFLQAATYAATVSGSVELLTGKHNQPASAQAGTVVWLEPLNRGQDEKPQHYTLVQRNKTFSPHVLVIPVDSIVDFPNFDPIFHNAFSNYDGQIFDIGLYPPGTSRSVRFSREGVVRVFCNIHASMSAVIVVVRTPYFAQTDGHGHYSIRNVRAGEYRVHYYHERAIEQTLQALVQNIHIEDEPVILSSVAISEKGFLDIPHLNKYGRPYGVASDSSSYPGARN